MVADDAMQRFCFTTTAMEPSPSCAWMRVRASLTMEVRVSGIGRGFRDYDNDGLPDVVITDLAKQFYALFHTRARECSAIEHGDRPGVMTAGSSGWVCGWRTSITMVGRTCLWLRAMLWTMLDRHSSLHYLQPPMLAFNREGQFGTEIRNNHSSGRQRRAFGDIDNDGGSMWWRASGRPSFTFSRPRRKRALADALAARNAEQSRRLWCGGACQRAERSMRPPREVI